MNILYTCDNNYIWLMGVSMISLFENNKEIKELNVYLLGEKISQDKKLELQSIAERYNRKVIVIDVPNFDIPDILISQRWPLSAFTRLFCGELLPEEVNRVLYLDCDTIIRGNINQLDEYDLNNATFAGVKDCIGNTYKTNIGLMKNQSYINAGVLLIDVDKLRKKEIRMLINRYLGKYARFINYADQDILNGVFKDDIAILPSEYNVMTIITVYNYEQLKTLRHPTNYYNKEELLHAASNPKVIHYTTNMRIIRPWFSNSNHPFKEEFIKYMSKSPWKNRTLDKFKFATNESAIIGVIQWLPSPLDKWLLGMIHAELKPRIIRLRNIRRK